MELPHNGVLMIHDFTPMQSSNAHHAHRTSRRSLRTRIHVRDAAALTLVLVTWALLLAVVVR